VNRISKKVREEATWICQLAASNGLGMLEVACAVDASGIALDLACKARHLVLMGSRHFVGSPEIRAEAECLLRTGWEPS
jgi:hypothetical protein